MTKSELLHKLYEECKTLNPTDNQELIPLAKSEEEADFIRVVSDFILQQRQKKAIAEKRF